MNIANDTNSISNINNGAQNLALEKISNTSAIDKVSDKSSSLAIDDSVKLQRSTMHQALEGINKGIGMSAVAQDGLSKQKDILDEINNFLLKASEDSAGNFDGKNVKNKMLEFLEQFDGIAKNTTYGGKQLIADEQQDLSVFTDGDDLINMQSQSTIGISSKIRSYLSDFSMDIESLKGLFNEVGEGTNKVLNFAGSYSNFTNELSSSGKKAISAQITLQEANNTILEADYSKEVTDFSKNNLMAQVGMLSTTQANAVQQRNVALLS